MRRNIIIVVFLVSLLVSGSYAASGGKYPGQILAQSNISVEALKGQTVTDVIIHVTPDIIEAKKIQLKSYYTNGTLKSTYNFDNMVAVNGIIQIQLSDLERQERIDARLQAGKGNWLEASAAVLLRPDIVFSSATSPQDVLVGERLFVNISLQEVKDDIGADAWVTLQSGETVFDTVNISVGAGGLTDAVLSTIFTSRSQYNLSLNIMNASPAEYDESNNIRYITVNAVSPDLSVTTISAPANVSVGETFNVLATISELYGELGANATVALIDNGTILDSGILFIPAGGSNIVSLTGSIFVVGDHNMVVRITSSDPPDNFQGNNELSFMVKGDKPLEPIAFSSHYYYQNTTINATHYITDNGLIDRGEELLQSEDEIISFTVSSNRILSFPVDRIYLNINNGSGEGAIYEETAVYPNESGIFSKYYPENNAWLTLRIDGNGTSMSIKSVANNSVKRSKGYLYWSYKGAQEWDVTTNSSIGRFIRAQNNLQVMIKLEDGTALLGGNSLTGIVNNSYTGGWVDTTEGRFEEKRTVHVYSGNATGSTVT